MRKKEVKMDNVTIVISPLSVDQVEAYIAPLEEVAANDNHGVVQKNRVYKLVLDGINNAMLNDDGEMPEDAKPWTRTQLTRRVDVRLLGLLQKTILEFSGFTLNEKQLEVPGESNAAAKSPSELEALSK